MVVAHFNQITMEFRLHVTHSKFFFATTFEGKKSIMRSEAVVEFLHWLRMHPVDISCYNYSEGEFLIWESILSWNDHSIGSEGMRDTPFFFFNFFLYYTHERDLFSLLWESNDPNPGWVKTRASVAFFLIRITDFEWPSIHQESYKKCVLYVSYAF